MALTITLSIISVIFAGLAIIASHRVVATFSLLLCLLAISAIISKLSTPFLTLAHLLLSLGTVYALIFLTMYLPATFNTHSRQKIIIPGVLIIAAICVILISLFCKTLAIAPASFPDQATILAQMFDRHFVAFELLALFVVFSLVAVVRLTTKGAKKC